MRLTVFAKGLILIAVPLAAQLLFLGLVAYVQYQQAEAQYWTTHTKGVIHQAQLLLGHLVDAQTATRGYVITSKHDFLEPYERTQRLLPERLTLLQAMVADNPEQAERVRRLGTQARGLMDHFRGKITLVQAGRRREAMERIENQEGKNRMDPFRQEVAAFLEVEEKLLEQRLARLEQVQWHLRGVLYTGVAVTFLGTILLAYLFFSNIGGRLATVTANAQRLAQGQGLLPPVSGQDEVAALDQAFREMAAALQRSRKGIEAAEARYRALVQASSQAVWSIGLGEMDAAWTKWWSQLSGRPADHLPDGGWLQDLHPDDQARAGQAWTQAAALRMPLQIEYRVRRHDGEYRHLEVRGVPLLNEEGQPAWIGTLTDITERKEGEERIRRLNEELEQRVVERTTDLAEINRELAAKSKENEMFVYSVSHDLRSPLVNLQGFSKELGLLSQDLRGLLATDEVPAKVRERGLALLDGGMAGALRYIQTAVTRLGGIIEALLRLSRAGRLTFNWQPVDMNAVVARVAGALHGTILERGAILHVARLPRVQGDPTALEQIFANLLGNAVQYLDPRRPGLIEVGCRDGAEEGLCTFFVRDNGVGIPPEYLPKVFQAFQRLHPEMAVGEGMGLTIVQRMVERHQGKIWVESRVGEGTTFFVSLPIVGQA